MSHVTTLSNSNATAICKRAVLKLVLIIISLRVDSEFCKLISNNPSMASINRSLLIALISIHLTATAIATEIHDLLPEYGLPKGILPNAVDSYNISPTDGAFTVQLKRPCYVKFEDQTVYYSKNIEGKLSYGSVSDVSGIQAKELMCPIVRAKLTQMMMNPILNRFKSKGILSKISSQTNLFQSVL
ncbi:unnamed protein product [Lactuca saligna]|uniref:Uncharacterized protein n=1 Tax=Lactuca saligna TaxID=75948 RepID=A0AA35V7Z2_LACSI|nr:unnamed protein product [Lactuca saligna]